MLAVHAIAGRHGGRPYFDSYETPWVHVCIWLESSASTAGFVLKSEPQNHGKANRRTAEYRISNVEGWFRCAMSN